MNLFDEYQALARSPTLSHQNVERMATIIEIASNDARLFEAIKSLDYLLAQEDGLLSPTNIQKYEHVRTQVIQDGTHKTKAPGTQYKNQVLVLDR
jgi:hypothetical protein